MERVTTTTLTTNEAAAAGAVVGSIFGAFFIAIFILYILTVIASWKIFEKAGEKGWKAIIPIYNIYIMFKIVNMKSWFWLTLCVGIICSFIINANVPASIYYTDSSGVQAIEVTKIPTIAIVAIVIDLIVTIWSGILYSWRTSKAFGHGIGYCIGLIFFPNIFWLILGFGKSKYSKKALKK